MKIIYLHQYFNTLKMPGGTRSYEMAKRLVSWGHEVHMITSNRDRNGLKKKNWYETRESGIRVHWLPVEYSNKMSYPSRIKAFLRFSYAAAHKAASFKGDIIFATSTPLTIALPAVYAAKKNKIPMIFEVRDLWPAVPIALGAIKNKILIKLSLWLENFAYCNANRIIALAPGMKEAIVQWGYPSDKVTVIPNGADLDLFDVEDAAGQTLRRELNWLGNRPLVVYAGTLGIVNGVDYLVYLAKEIKNIDKDICFVVIGDGKEENKIKELAKISGVLDDNFFMIGRIPKKEIPKWLSASDLAIITYTGPKVLWKDSVSNKVFDALAAGKPIVSNLPGWCEVLAEQSGAGIIIDASNYKVAAEELVKTIRNKTWLEKAGKNALALARDVFSRDKLAKKLEGVLVEAVNENRKA